MDRIAFGYLNKLQQCNNSLVASKCRQLTRLFQNKIIPAAPSCEAETLEDLIDWALTTKRPYLYVQEYGHIMEKQEGLKDMVDTLEATPGLLAVADHDSTNTLITSSILLDLRNTTRFKNWQEQTHLIRDIRPNTKLVSTFLNPLVEPHLIELAIRDFDYHGLNLLEGDQYDFLFRHKQHPLNSYSLPVLLRDEPEYFTHPLRIPNSSFLGKSHQNHHELSRNRHEQCRELQVEIGTFYSITRGFRPFKILQERGFAANTKLVFFDVNHEALLAYKVLLELWDGADLPRFLEVNPFLSSRHIIAAQDGLSIEQTWQKTLETFGGENEFRVLWQAIRKLRRLIIYSNVITPNAVETNLFDEIGTGHNEFVYWGNIFSDTNLHVHYSEWEIGERFTHFINTIRTKNPHIRMEGWDHMNGRTFN